MKKDSKFDCLLRRAEGIAWIARLHIAIRQVDCAVALVPLGSTKT